MARKKSVSKKKISKKEIIIFCVVAVLIIVALVILTTDNKLNNYITNYLEQLANEQPEQPTTQTTPTDGKVFTSILSGKGNIILPSNFDTENLLEVHFIDIGQGDAIVINFPDRKTMIIDSGTTSNGLSEFRTEYLQYLDDITDNKLIEYMVITHPDTDHYNMLKKVVEDYEVQNTYYNEYTGTTYNELLEVLAAEENINLNEVDNNSATYVIEGAGYKVTIYCCGDSAFSSADEKNNQSIVCMLEYGDRRILLTGDAGVDTEQWFISELGTPYKDIDVLKVGHHGSDTSTSEFFLEFIDAEYAVISCDDGTSYGHPDDVVMERLDNYGIATYRTNRHGNILLYVDGDGDFGFLTENQASVENNSNNIDQRKIPLAG